ncbi:MAG TPA: PAS domain S-box protein [Chthoniobacter sp.]|nr:PAS domain S-box protein [Chthoniobacter sp.]
MTEGPTRVLLIEDNSMDARLMEMLLTKATPGQYEIERVERLKDGIERVKRGGVDVILLDLNLPDSRSSETFMNLHACATEIPIIALTGMDDTELAITTVQHGAQDYLVKQETDGRLLDRSIRYAIERMRIKRAFNEQRLRVATLLESIPDRIYFKDASSRFIEVNPATARSLGLVDPSVAVGRSDFDFYTPDQAKAAFDDEMAAICSGEPVIGKLERETRADGAVRWLSTTKMPMRNEQGRIVGTFGISRDVTELKRAEEALRESEARYRELLSTITDYIYTVWLKDGAQVGTTYGKGCVAVTGYSPEDFTAEPYLWHRIVHPEDQALVDGNIQRVKRGEVPGQIEYRILHRDGSIRWLSNRCVPRYSELGAFVAYDGLVSDITARKTAEEQLTKAHHKLHEAFARLSQSHKELLSTQMQLFEAEKLQSVGRLAAGVAHEVKNPLAILQMGIGCLRSGNGDSGEVLEEMMNAVRRADTVISGLLDFSSPKELNLHETEVNAVVRRALDFVKHELMRAHVKLVTAFSEDLPPCRLDHNKIEQVLINVFTNAYQAMPEGGTLTISTFQKRLEADEVTPDAGNRSGVRFRQGDHAIVVQVKDSGTGIPEANIARIFEPFFTTKPTGKGTGLGLTVAQKIVDLHAGRMTIHNNAGGGAVVRIMFKPTKGYEP